LRGRILPKWALQEPFRAAQGLTAQFRIVGEQFPGQKDKHGKAKKRQEDSRLKIQVPLVYSHGYSIILKGSPEKAETIMRN
jgi:hypothetical protein